MSLCNRLTGGVITLSLCNSLTGGVITLSLCNRLTGGVITLSLCNSLTGGVNSPTDGVITPLIELFVHCCCHCPLESTYSLLNHCHPLPTCFRLRFIFIFKVVVFKGQPPPSLLVCSPNFFHSLILTIVCFHPEVTLCGRDTKIQLLFFLFPVRFSGRV